MDEGIEALRQVGRQAETRTTHWRYVVYWLVALGHLIAGDGPDRTAILRRALVEARDSSMYWSISFVVEIAALFCAQRGEPHLAAGALAGLDADLVGHGGRPPSGHPGTILHPIRQDLTKRLHLDELIIRPLKPGEAVEQLRRYLDAP